MACTSTQPLRPTTATPRAAGLDVGVYYYTYATSEAMADAELALVRKAVYGKELTMPLAVDVEENKLKPMSTLDLTNLTAYALEQVEKMGFYAQLYTYTHYSNMELDMGRLASRWDVWLSDTTGHTPAVGYHYNAHQHTSKGRVPGISGNVDLNVTGDRLPPYHPQEGSDPSSGGQMTEKEALLWVVGILGSLCAAAITIDKVLEIIHKYIKKAQAPDDAQNKRMDELDKRIGTLEQGQLQHTQALARDLRRFEGIDEVSRLTLNGVRNLLDAQLSGNNREGMQKSRTDIDNYLLKGVTNHGSDS